MNFQRVAIISMAIAVILGAFGAHSLRDILDERMLKAWNTGVQYQVYHSLGILLLGLYHIADARRKWLRRSMTFLLIGIVMFSGSLYLLCMGEVMQKDFSWAGPITPVGGLCFIAGWIMALPALHGHRIKNSEL